MRNYTHIVSENILFSTKAFFFQKISIFLGKNGTFTQDSSVRVVSEISFQDKRLLLMKM